MNPGKSRLVTNTNGIYVIGIFPLKIVVFDEFYFHQLLTEIENANRFT